MAEELGILAKMIRSFVQKDFYELLDEEEDNRIESVIHSTLEKLGDLTSISDFGKQNTPARKGIPVLKVDQLKQY
jgi:hypothetical protein